MTSCRVQIIIKSSDLLQECLQIVVMTKLCISAANNHQTRQASVEYLAPLRPRTNLIKYTVLHRVITGWNSSPFFVITTNTSGISKRILKKDHLTRFTVIRTKSVYDWSLWCLFGDGTFVWNVMIGGWSTWNTWVKVQICYQKSTLVKVSSPLLECYLSKSLKCLNFTVLKYQK